MEEKEGRKHSRMKRQTKSYKDAPTLKEMYTDHCSLDASNALKTTSICVCIVEGRLSNTVLDVNCTRSAMDNQTPIVLCYSIVYLDIGPILT